MKKITAPQLLAMKQGSEKIACLTAYDASFAALCSDAGIDVILIGDSLGMVCQGHHDITPVTVDDIHYHVQAVCRAEPHSLVIADMPFLSYTSAPETIANARRLIQVGAQMVKMEGGQWLCETIAHLTQLGVPVCGHLGLSPQSIHKLGKYSVQGKDDAAANAILADALALQEAGASLLVLECVPQALATKITAQLSIPTIGIGAGAQCDGQILVCYDMLGITSGRPLKFVQNFLTAEHPSVLAAMQAYVTAVKNSSFPNESQVLA